MVQVRPDVEHIVGRTNMSEYVVVAYRGQVVAGMIYRMKVGHRKN